MIYTYRLCLTLFESNTDVIHSMFLFTPCSELPAIQEIAKIDGSKNWKRKKKQNKAADHQLDTIKCYL